MKKIYIIIALVLCGFAQIAEAQNLYRNYISSPNAVPRPTSAVSIMHSNGFVYYFQADDYGHLSATEIDPMSMMPTGNDTAFLFQNGHVHLNGCFENASGEFILFGYYYQYNNPYSYHRPAYILVKQSFSGCNAYYLSNVDWGEFTAGCSGYNQSGQEVFILKKDNGDLTATNAFNPNISYRISLAPIASNYYYYSDISWDVINGHFIATGSAQNSPTGHEDPFVHIFDLFTNFTVDTKAEYYVCDQLYNHANEFKSLHVQIDNDNLILYHDLRRFVNQGQYSQDIIWLTRIKYFWNVTTAMITESWYYHLPSSKLFAKDLLYDSFNERLNFLGYYNHCIYGLTQLLAQIDPYKLSTGIEIGQLGASFPGTGTCLDSLDTSIHILYNDLEMFNLALNVKNPCNPVLVAGVDNKKSILTETYDISQSRCDIPIWHEDKPANPNLIPCSLNIAYHPDTFQLTIANAIPENLTNIKLCDEPDACSHQYGGKTLQQFLTNGNIAARITMETSHQFVCEGFEGNIQYFLYDMAGKILQRGITQNGEQNMLKVSNGIYLLKAMDAKGIKVVRKTIVL
jgi:hypothetical protein